ncbi:MAG: hypothetical protein H7210_06135 [Pyrinomonadaceae bacterium]|nr:hypothetical protein [Phycisphaerales bacterium]
MSLTCADANAWLAARLKEWVVNQDGSFTWPSELSSLQVDFRDGEIVFGAGLMYRGAVRVVSLTMTPRVDDKGALWIPATSFAIGKLGVPSSLVESILRSSLPANSAKNESTAKLFDALAGKAPISESPVMKLSDGRRVLVVGIRSEQGRLLVTCKPAAATR